MPTSPPEIPEEVEDAIAFLMAACMGAPQRDIDRARGDVRTAIRRSILEARLDEHEHGHRLNTASMDRRREDLRKQLAALKEGE